MKEVKEKLPTTSLPPPPTPRQSLKPLFLSVSVILLLLYSLSPSPPPPTSLSGYLSFLHPRPPHPSPESLILTLPSPTSAREASESFTKVTHIAGTDSDRLSALRVKDQWEGLLGLKRSGGGRVFESGSWESRRFLIGGGRGKGRGGWMRKLRKWVRWGKTEKARVWIDTYYPFVVPTLLKSTLTNSLLYQTTKLPSIPLSNTHPSKRFNPLLRRLSNRRRSPRGSNLRGSLRTHLPRILQERHRLRTTSLRRNR